VKAIRAHVQNGTIVPDEPIDLPEGAMVEILLPENEEMTPEERAELEAEVEASAAEFERGEFEDAHAFALRLVAKS
jgi:predicted DNA-binding antitoxin AbrB/MazE fold protein